MDTLMDTLTDMTILTIMMEMIIIMGRKERKRMVDIIIMD